MAELAERYTVPPAQVALAWLLQKPPVSAPIVGATTTAHIDIAIGALSVSLTSENIAFLEEPYLPHAVVGPE